jgi:DNA-binding XRE family transcriptional regulator
MALDELRGAKRLTQTEVAEILGVPQSSICRIEQRTDMYLSTLRNYIHAVGGELRIQAVFPDGGTVVIDRFGEYEERPYVVHAMAAGRGAFQLCGRPLHHSGPALSTRAFALSKLSTVLRALHFPEAQIAHIESVLQNSVGENDLALQPVFSLSDLVEAGFEAVDAQSPDDL